MPWGWGVNGAMSVIGTSIATLIAIYGGFTTTFLIGAAVYAASGILGSVLERRYRSLNAP